MKYKIITIPKYTNTVKIGIETDPDNEPLKFFLSGVVLEKFPTLLDNISRSEGFATEMAGVTTFSSQDEYDLSLEGAINKGEIEVYHNVFGSCVMNETLFDHILYEYSVKLLEAYQNTSEVSSDWCDKMKDEIDKLRQKISHRG